MSYFMHTQDLALRQLMQTIIEENKDPKLVKLIQENNLLEAVDKAANVETTIEDITHVAENESVTLTREQEMRIAYAVIEEWDASDYNEFISDKIQEELDGLDE